MVVCFRDIPEKSVSWGQNAIDIKLSWWGVKLHLKFDGWGVNKEKECIGGRGHFCILIGRCVSVNRVSLCFISILYRSFLFLFIFSGQ
jgi:hypothetical protein